MTNQTRPGVPTATEVLSLEPVIRQVAPAVWEDENGHVNVGAHYAFHMEAATRGIFALGWNEDYRERTGNSMFSVEQHIRFHDEVLVGHDVSAHFRLLARSERMIHAVSVIVNHTTGRVANTLELVEGHVDLGTRRTAPFPAELSDTLDQVLAAHRQLDWAVPLNTGMGLR